MTAITDISVQTADGVNAGKVLLIVNVASKCGFTPQYTGLEELPSPLRRSRVRSARFSLQPVWRAGVG